MLAFWRGGCLRERARHAALTAFRLRYPCQVVLQRAARSLKTISRPTARRYSLHLSLY